jgi:capsular exopolysaccharide synthesis family protein
MQLEGVFMSEQDIYTQNDDIDVKEIFRTLNNYKWSIVVITIISIITASIYLYFQQPIYSSYAIIKVKTKESTKNINNNILNPISGPDTANVKEDMALIKTFYINDQALKLGRVNYTVQYYENRHNKSVEITKLIPIKVTDIEILDKKFLGRKLTIIQKDNGYIIKIKHSILEKLKAKLFNRSLKQIKQKKPFAYNTIISTPYFKIKVIRLANYAKAIDVKINQENRYIYENIIKDNLKVTQLEDDISLIKISYKDNIQSRGLLYINSLTDSLIKESIKNKNEQNNKVLNFIIQELNKIKGKLSKSETKLEQYRIKNDVIQPSVQTSTFISELANIDIKLSENMLKEKIIQNIDNILQKEYNLDAISPLLMALNDNATLKLIEVLQDTQLKRDELLSEFTYKHPTIKALQRKIDTTKSKISSNIKNLKKSIKDTNNNLKKLKNSYESRIKRLPTKERRVVNIKRDYEVSSKMYNFLLQKKAENEMARVATLSDYKIIDKAYSKLDPISPNYKLILIAFTILGVITGIIFAFIRSAISDKIIDKEDIENETPISIYGVVPSTKNEDLRIRVYDNLSSYLTESYRNLRTTLQLGLQEDNKVILITSTVKGERANIVTANLGAVFGMASYKTIVIDLDIRNPSLDKIFGFYGDVKGGLASYLLGRDSFEDIIYHSKYDNVDVIPVGAVSNNPSELILSNLLSILIERLKKEYDYIIINSTPFGFIQDTKYIMKFSDINLVVFRAEYSKKSDIVNLNRVVREDNIKNIKIVFMEKRV